MGSRRAPFVYTEREAAAARLMPVKQVADSGKAVRCPMPGLVISIAVREGQEVKAGETLAVVEAMKMENVLRAERDGTVKAIKAKPGDSLARGRGDHGVCVIRPRPAVSPQAPASFALLDRIARLEPSDRAAGSDGQASGGRYGTQTQARAQDVPDSLPKRDEGTDVIPDAVRRTDPRSASRRIRCHRWTSNRSSGPMRFSATSD